MLDEIQQGTGFDVLDDGSIDTVLGQKRLGVVAPMLEWRTHRPRLSAPYSSSASANSSASPSFRLRRRR